MLALKERRIIKKVATKYADKSWASSMEIFYERTNQYTVDELKRKLDKAMHEEQCIKVKAVDAYYDLMDSYERMRKFIEKNAPEKHITVNGIEGPLRELSFEHCFFKVTCNFYIENAKNYNELNKKFTANSEIENRALIAIINILNYRNKELDASTDAFSVANAVKSIKEAEEKYGKKFFVNDYLYDTFTRPELFDSYGVYKKGEVFSMNKSNIIQDNL